MFECFDPKISRLLKKNTSVISGFSTESKVNILELAESGNYRALKQEIEYVGLGGDY